MHYGIVFSVKHIRYCFMYTCTCVWTYLTIVLAFCIFCTISEMAAKLHVHCKYILNSKCKHKFNSQKPKSIKDRKIIWDFIWYCTGFCPQPCRLQYDPLKCCLFFSNDESKICDRMIKLDANGVKNVNSMVQQLIHLKTALLEMGKKELLVKKI